MDEKGLLQLKDKIEQSKTKASELQGQREYLMNELNTQWGCKTIEEAKIKEDKMRKNVEKLDAQIKESNVSLSAEMKQQ